MKKRINIREDFEAMLDRLTALHFDIVDQSAEYLLNKLYELKRDYTTREDFYSFRGMLNFAFDIGLIKQSIYDIMTERVAEIWDAYQEAGAPPTAIGAPPTDPEQIALFT